MPTLTDVTTTHPADSYGTEVIDAVPGALDELVADGADVARRLADLPPQRVVRSPARAVEMVSGLDSYGD